MVVILAFVSIRNVKFWSQICFLIEVLLVFLVSGIEFCFSSVMKLVFGFVYVSVDFCGRFVVNEFGNFCLLFSRLVELVGNCTRFFINVSVLKISSKMWERIEKYVNFKCTSWQRSIRGCGILLGLFLICIFIIGFVFIFVI